MTPEQVRGKTAKALFLAAVQLPPEEREAFLQPTAERDPDLAREVRELLSYDEGSDDILDQSILASLEIEAEPERLELPEGTLLAGRYRIEGPLGSGASSDVYRGRDELLAGKKVAVKLLRHQAGGAAFFREMEALARINNPGIMQVLDLGDTGDGHSFLVTEFTPGRTLRSVLSLQALPHDRVLRLVRQVGLALSAAHAQGVSHLDLKPENILVVDFGSPEERIRIIDFGLAGIVDAPRRGAVGGSPAYMAPEQAGGQGGPAADQYSLAAVAVEMLAGRPPGLQRSVHALFENNCPSVPAAAVGVLARALSPNPAARFASTGEFLSAFSAGMDAPPKRVPRWLAVSVAAVCALAVGVGAGLLWRPPATQPEEFLPLLRVDGQALSASISPDGETVYYVLHGTGNGDIYSARSGATPVRLTRHDAAELSPACSPDGKRIAFLRHAGGDVRAILVMAAAGGPTTPVAEGQFADVTWAPDNRRLVVTQTVEDGVRTKLTVIDTVTRQWRDLTAPGKGSRDLHPTVARDGSGVAFVRRGAFGTAAAYVLDLNPGLEPSGEPRELVRGIDPAAALAWAPDSREVIVPLGPDMLETLWRVPRGGGPAVEITSAGRTAHHPMVPAGRDALAFVRSTPVATLWRLDLDSPGGAATGGAAIYPSLARNELPSLAQDRKPPALAFSARRARQGLPLWAGVLSDSAAGGQDAAARPMQAPSALTVFLHMCWAGQGRYVVSGLTSESQFSAYLVGPNGDQQRLDDVDGPVFWISPERGQRLILFGSERNGERQIWVRPGSRAAFALTRGGGDFGLPSPDLSTVYYSKAPDALWRIPFGGGEESLFLRGMAGVRDFTIGRTGIYYLSRQQPPRIRLRRFDDGRDVEIHRLDRSAARGLAVSADERTIIYSQNEPVTTEISLVDNFR
ncbi:MAG: protein kinase [Bryobacteraceae bacterium]